MLIELSSVEYRLTVNGKEYFVEEVRTAHNVITIWVFGEGHSFLAKYSGQYFMDRHDAETILKKTLKPKAAKF